MLSSVITQRELPRIYSAADVGVFTNIDSNGLDDGRNFAGENTNKGGQRYLF